jgi:carbamoyltransferase
MKILAITNHFESSAALYANEKMYAVSEERFTRTKNQGGMPIKSINWLLTESNLKLEDIDFFYYCSIGDIYPDADQYDEILTGIDNSHSEYDKKIILKRAMSEAVYNSKVIENFRDWAILNNIADYKIQFLDHHKAHALGVINFYELDDAIIFTCDGKGGFTSSAVWEWSKESLKRLIINGSHNSLGYLYGNYTIALGYQAERHEGKLTGLAAFDVAPLEFEKLNPFKVVSGKIVGNNFEGIYMPFFNRTKDSQFSLDEFEKITKSWTREQVAATAQLLIETTILEWIEHAMERNQGRNICLSGGVFANVKLNQKIREKFGNSVVYVNPAMGDTGLVLGAAGKGLKINSTVGAYLGPNYDDFDIFNSLDEKKYHVHEILNIDELVKFTIEKFELNSPFGFFHGPMEFGPRALCHRSIIFHAIDKTANEWLNTRMNRSDFMPFAPVVLDIDAAKFFHGYLPNQQTSEFMTMTYSCTDEFIQRAPAVVHVDKTARPQILKKSRDPWFYDYLHAYTRKTGQACLMNTSFNNHEEPIVCTPHDAVSSLDRKNVDFVVFGKKYLIERI